MLTRGSALTDIPVGGLYVLDDLEEPDGYYAWLAGGEDTVALPLIHI